MIDNLEQYKEVLSVYKERKSFLAEKQEEFNASNEILIDDIKALSRDVHSMQDIISTQCIEKYDKTGNKEIGEGLSIKIMTSYNYDEKLAFDWALTHKLCLQLDTKAFKSIMKTQSLDFVTTKEKKVACFSAALK